MMLRGAQLRVDEYNRNNGATGYALKLSVADDGSSPKSRFRPAEVAKELIKQQHLLAVIGHYHDRATDVALPVYSSRGIPVISPSASTTHLSNSAKGDLFCLNFDRYAQGIFIREFLSRNPTIEDIVLIHDRRSESEPMIRALSQRSSVRLLALELGASMKSLFESRQADLLEADAVVLSVTPDNAAQALKYLKRIDPRAEVYGTNGLSTKHFLDNADYNAEGLYTASSWIPDLTGRGATLFESRFQQAYKESPDWLAAHSYQAVDLIIQAITESGSDARRVVNFFKKKIDLERQRIA
jgi:branched-chain amino acid transport system substrate-binding protein